MSWNLLERGDAAPTKAPQSVGTAGQHQRGIRTVVDLDGSTIRRSVRQRPVGTGYLPYRYDVHGILTIGSKVALPELESFRAPGLGKDYDIAIRIGDVGRTKPRRRAKLVRGVAPVAVCYEEQLGRLGANFVVSMGDRIDVTVSPLLARSRHVLYTNVIEALLRFCLVDRGRMLLHSACVELDGRGILLSARTDTGKTGTILRLLREQPGARFLSDDMTIISPDGTALSYPKPLTISQHTLKAVDPGDLPPLEWRILQFKGRVHSKEGRSFGMRLGEWNIPIMAVNSLTQLVVPPPKYPVDRLVDCQMIPTTTLDSMYIIERGDPSLSTIATDRLLDELIANTDDAYGFPPFSDFAPAIVLGGSDYDELRRSEREILATAISDVPAFRLVSDSFTWADDIPRHLQQTQAMMSDRARESTGGRV